MPKHNRNPRKNSRDSDWDFDEGGAGPPPRIFELLQGLDQLPKLLPSANLDRPQQTMGSRRRNRSLFGGAGVYIPPSWKSSTPTMRERSVMFGQTVGEKHTLKGIEPSTTGGEMDSPSNSRKPLIERLGVERN
jgi:hypothetical protein